MEKLENNWDEFAPLFFTYKPDKIVSEKLKSFYMGDLTLAENQDEFKKQLSVLCSDWMFIYPSRESAIKHSKVAPTYFYYYTYESAMPSMYSLFRAADPDSWFPGAFSVLRCVLVDAYKKYQNSTSGPHNYGIRTILRFFGGSRISNFWTFSWFASLLPICMVF